MEDKQNFMYLFLISRFGIPQANKNINLLLPFIIDKPKLLYAFMILPQQNHSK